MHEGGSAGALSAIETVICLAGCVKPRVTCDLTVLVVSRVTFAFLCPTVGRYCLAAYSRQSVLYAI